MDQKRPNEKQHSDHDEFDLERRASAPGKAEVVAADQETAKYASGGLEISEADNRRMFWKVCRRILPIMLVTYFCQSLDKGTMGLSSIMGIIEDANLQGQDVRVANG